MVSQFNNGISRFIGWDEERKFDHANVNSRQVIDILSKVSCGGTDLSEGIEYMLKRCNNEDIIVIVSDLYTERWEKFKDIINTVAKKRTVIIGVPSRSNYFKKDLKNVIIVQLN